jgi:peptidoglycan hydrolase-like protein with peptidoglycan-binding domain
VRIQPKVLSSIVALALAMPAAPAAWADGSAFVGGLVGGIVGSAIGNAATQRRETVVVRQAPRTVVRHAPAVNTYDREQNRQAQVALNHFGFPAGVPDGVMGRNSRAAVAQYQSYVGMPATGYLSEYDRTQLITAYNRSLVGGPQNQQMMVAYGQGMRGLLLGYRDEQIGVPMPGAATAMAAAPTVMAAAPMAAAPTAPVAAAPEPVATPLPEIAAPVAPSPEPAATVMAAALPDFQTTAAPDASMASACNRASLVTSTNGGFVTVASLKDPGFALEEQFCLARTYAIEEGERLAATVQGMPAAEIRTRCEAFAPAMRPYVAMLATEPAQEVTEAARGFIVETGAPPAQIAANARICLGVGYRTDNAELALGSALMLAAAGEAAYGEHVGHHLLQGFGVARRGDRAAEWLGDAVAAMSAGASQVVAPGAPERIELLRTALAMTTGREVVTEAAAAAPASPVFVLPVAPATSN